MFEAIDFLEINEVATNNDKFKDIVFVDVHFKANYETSKKVIQVSVKEKDGEFSIVEADGAANFINSVSVYYKCHEWTNPINIEGDPEGISDIEEESFISLLSIFVKSYINRTVK